MAMYIEAFEHFAVDGTHLLKQRDEEVHPLGPEDFVFLRFAGAADNIFIHLHGPASFSHEPTNMLGNPPPCNRYHEGCKEVRVPNSISPHGMYDIDENIVQHVAGVIGSRIAQASGQVSASDGANESEEAIHAC